MSAGLHCSWTIPGKRPLNILQTIGNGCAFLDYDNDSFPDIYLTAYRGGVLLHNEGGYGFRVVPLALQPWSTSARS